MTIKELRQKYELTQTEMSNITEIPVRTIQDWEAGKRECRDYLLNLIEFYLEHREDDKK